MTEFTYQWNPEWEEDEAMPQLKVTKSSLNTFFLLNYTHNHRVANSWSATENHLPVALLGNGVGIGEKKA